MTSSEKPESSGPQDADQASVSTQTVDSTAEADTESGSAAAEAASGEELNGTETPPPWQRASASASGAEGTDSTPGTPVPDVDDTQTIPKQFADQETVRTKVPQSARTTVSFTGAGAGSGSSARNASTPSARRPSRGPRRASLQVKRVDPWSVLKLALVLSVALFFVWMIAVAVLYGVLDGMGVWEQLNGTFSELTQPDDAAAEPLISAARVFGVASIIGAINIVLVTALATVAAFIYNVAADFAGGVEITLSERE
ncbi:DUF3566 domain-containing protein [Saccharopolyspora oryzae]|uniref:DUF3566 domain-containing protein n=1 Tax=Saccharopolyspora oryzae TaxID=2997343 RepID=A0ABT4V5B7_9PSEU|nr:DUF3566 domain-containing protein [Saccharopolyspora oryzae]MDA3628599.1 DUF3566 domain-containing protein [Saccharopolyspora oryzae]